MERRGTTGLFEKFTGALPISEAFGIFLYEVFIVWVWSWFFAHCNHGEGCCYIAMGLGRRLCRSEITIYSARGGAFLSYLSQFVMHFSLSRGEISHFGCLFSSQLHRLGNVWDGMKWELGQCMITTDEN